MDQPDSISNGGRATSTQPSIWSRAIVFFAFAVTFVLASIAILRFAYYDGRHPLIWLNAFTLYVYLPAYACLAIGLWKRNRWLTIANVAIIGCHLYLIAPDFIPDRRFEASTAATTTNLASTKKLRIFFANVRLFNSEIDAFLNEIARADPDVIVLAEFYSPWYEIFQKSPIIAKYPYGNGLNEGQLGDVVIFSKRPTEQHGELYITDRAVRSIDIPVDGRSLKIVGLHAPRPMNFHDNDYDGFWKVTIPYLLSATRPFVVVGDCNATQYSRVYQQLKAGGLRSAHEVCGRGYATTWPNGTLLLPPIRIDQAFLSPEVACSSIKEGEGPGSDHKPLILDVQLGESH
jgi:endonuclease/exonuclease/phosphatase (EEP) superfamily protein YafD